MRYKAGLCQQFSQICIQIHTVKIKKTKKAPRDMMSKGAKSTLLVREWLDRVVDDFVRELEDSTIVFDDIEAFCVQEIDATPIPGRSRQLIITPVDKEISFSGKVGRFVVHGRQDTPAEVQCGHCVCRTLEQTTTLFIKSNHLSIFAFGNNCYRHTTHVTLHTR